MPSTMYEADYEGSVKMIPVKKIVLFDLDSRKSVKSIHLSRCQYHSP